MRKATMFLSVALVAACGGSSQTPPGGGPPAPPDVPVLLSPGSGTTDVTTPGADYAMTPVEALSYVQSTTCPPFAQYTSPFGLTYLIVELGDAPGRCERLAAGKEKAESGVARIQVIRRRDDGVVPGFRVGSYPLSVSGVSQPDGTVEIAMVRLYTHDFWCGEYNDSATDGTVTIDGADAAGVWGSISVNMQYGGTITGSFATKPCAVDVFYDCTGLQDFPVITACVQ